MKTHQFTFLAAFAFLAGFTAFSQESEPAEIEIPFTDPGRGGLVKVDSGNTGITVIGYAGTTVRVTHGDGGKPPPAAGHALTNAVTLTGLEAREESNVVTLKQVRRAEARPLHLLVPYKTSLQLKCGPNSSVQVRKVAGEIEASVVNGSIIFTECSGPVLADALNGRISVQLDALQGGKPSSLSALNGSIEVTLPAAVKANVALKSQNGRVQSDFNITERTPKAARKPKQIIGTINGGGPDIQITTQNGSIHLQKAGQPAIDGAERIQLE